MTIIWRPCTNSIVPLFSNYLPLGYILETYQVALQYSIKMSKNQDSTPFFHDLVRSGQSYIPKIFPNSVIWTSVGEGVRE